jgi:hypothetical protein
MRKMRVNASLMLFIFLSSSTINDVRSQQHFAHQALFKDFSIRGSVYPSTFVFSSFILNYPHSAIVIDPSVGVIETLRVGFKGTQMLMRGLDSTIERNTKAGFIVWTSDKQRILQHAYLLMDRAMFPQLARILVRSSHYAVIDYTPVQEKVAFAFLGASPGSPVQVEFPEPTQVHTLTEPFILLGSPGSNGPLTLKKVNTLGLVYDGVSFDPEGRLWVIFTDSVRFRYAPLVEAGSSYTTRKDGVRSGQIVIDALRDFATEYRRKYVVFRKEIFEKNLYVYLFSPLEKTYMVLKFGSSDHRGRALVVYKGEAIPYRITNSTQFVVENRNSMRLEIVTIK